MKKNPFIVYINIDIQLNFEKRKQCIKINLNKKKTQKIFEYSREKSPKKLHNFKLKFFTLL